MSHMVSGEKVERLEAELAATKDEFAMVIDLLEAELADLRASSVVVRERCKTCGGEGVTEIWDAPTPGDGPRCPDCVNGWRLAEGVVGPYSYPLTGRMYLIEARLIEGGTDE